MAELHAKHCVPCRGGVPLLKPEEAASLFPDGHTRLVRGFAFKNYADTLAFVNAISAVAEAEGHHSDIMRRLGLRDGDPTGLHENDFIMAAKFERVFTGEAAA